MNTTSPNDDLMLENCQECLLSNMHQLMQCVVSFTTFDVIDQEGLRM